MAQESHSATPISRHVSYSELSSFRRCIHLWDLEYRQRWRPVVVSAALNKGRLFHEVMALHYGGADGTIDSLGINDLLHQEDGTQDETQELVEWMYEGYCQMWGSDPQWNILECEQTSRIWLPTEHTRRTGRSSRTQLKMILDLLIKDDMGRVWLVDHKTGAQLPNEMDLEHDDQFSLYQWGKQQEGIEIAGIIYNAVRTQRNKGPMAPDDRFRRVMMYRTPEQLENTAIDAYRTTLRMRAVPPGESERCFGLTRCMKPYRCQFVEPCLHGRKGGDEVDFLQSMDYVQQQKKHTEEGL
jgi:hypothetical protein